MKAYLRFRWKRLLVRSLLLIYLLGFIPTGLWSLSWEGDEETPEPFVVWLLTPVMLAFTSLILLIVGGGIYAIWTSFDPKEERDNTIKELERKLEALQEEEEEND